MSDYSGSADKAKEIFKKFLSPNSKPTMETFPELVDCIIWLRFVLAIFFGIWIGNETPNRGGANIMFGLNFIAFVPILYCQTFLGTEQDSYGSKLLFAGVVQALGLSMLIWIYFYTDQHPEDKNVFSAAYSKLVTEEVVISSVTGDAPEVPDESEF
mmetsp:Transcript_16873/g.38694  ORF Transcript_16873/g.38694 Transcript_16873/m.38694 type:complete len:156 (-) Transcript_16873:191-658(-)